MTQPPPPAPRRVLALDHGSARIGVALSDEPDVTTRDVALMQGDGNFKRFVGVPRPALRLGAFEKLSSGMERLGHFVAGFRAANPIRENRVSNKLIDSAALRLDEVTGFAEPFAKRASKRIFG